MLHHAVLRLGPFSDSKTFFEAAELASDAQKINNAGVGFLEAGGRLVAPLQVR